jgi:hypothetical protein
MTPAKPLLPDNLVAIFDDGINAIRWLLNHAREKPKKTVGGLMECFTIEDNHTSRTDETLERLWENREAIAEILNTRTAPTVPEWLPIESALRDGAEIWAFQSPEHHQCLMKWVEGEGYALWIYADENLADIDPDPKQPTHWMPLPAAPENKGGSDA